MPIDDTVITLCLRRHLNSLSGHRTHCHSHCLQLFDVQPIHVLTDDDRRPRFDRHPKGPSTSIRRASKCPYTIAVIHRYQQQAITDPSLDAMTMDDSAYTIVVMGMVAGGHDILTVKLHANYCSYRLQARSASVPSSLISILSCFYFF